MRPKGLTQYERAELRLRAFELLKGYVTAAGAPLTLTQQMSEAARLIAWAIESAPPE